MEMKSIKPNSKLLKSFLINQKNWFLLTTIILIIFNGVLPLIANENPLYFVPLGGALLFCITFIMIHIQFHFLHDEKKFAYYASKPLSLLSRIHTLLLSQLIFNAFFIMLLVLWTRFCVSFKPLSYYSFDYYRFIGVLASWMIVFMFIAALSSLLSGNTFIASIASIFNFALPLLFLGIIYLGLNVANKLSLGFDISLIMNQMISVFYRLDYFYHLHEKIGLSLFSTGIHVIIIYSLTLLVFKYRKHERIGQFIVFNSYKIFVLSVVSVFVPFIFSFTFPQNSHIFLDWLIVMLLGGITFYVGLIILERSFKAERRTFVMIGGFLATTTIIIMLSGFGLRVYQNTIPHVGEVKAAILIDYTDTYRYFYGRHDSRSSDEYFENLILKGVPVFREKESIDQIIVFHEKILEGTPISHHHQVTIVYYFEDGSRKIFPFSLHSTSVNPEMSKKWYGDFLSLNEYKEVYFPIFYKDLPEDSELTLHFSSGDLNQDRLSIRMDKEKIQAFREIFEVEYFENEKDLLMDSFNYISPLNLQDVYYPFNEEGRDMRINFYYEQGGDLNYFSILLWENHVALWQLLDEWVEEGSH